MSGRGWSSEDLLTLQSLYLSVPKVPVEEIASVLGRSNLAVQQRVTLLGLHRDHALDLTNQIFGELTALKPAPHDLGDRTKWLCRCSCGRSVVVCTQNLTKGQTRSCGHLRGANQVHEDPSTRVCSRCHRILSLNKFYRNGDRFWSWCKGCEGVAAKKRANTLPRRISQLLQAMKTRHPDTDVDHAYLMRLAEKQELRCDDSKYPMTLDGRGSSSHAKPTAMSVDAKEPTQGHYQGNVRLVCWEVNRIKADRSWEVWLKVRKRLEGAWDLLLLSGTR